VGLVDGMLVGFTDVVFVFDGGVLVGIADGALDGDTVRDVEGVFDGTCVGVMVGSPDRDVDRSDVG